MKSLLFDLARVLLFPKDKNYLGTLNGLHAKLSQNPKYKFLDNFKFNEELLSYLKTLASSTQIHIFTSKNIQETPEVKARLKGIFKQVFSAASLGMQKADPDVYKLIAKKLNLKPSQIVFVDDAEKNVSAARQAGLTAIHYTSNKKLFSSLKPLVS